MQKTRTVLNLMALVTSGCGSKVAMGAAGRAGHPARRRLGRRPGPGLLHPHRHQRPGRAQPGHPAGEDTLVVRVAALRRPVTALSSTCHRPRLFRRASQHLFTTLVRRLQLGLQPRLPPGKGKGTAFHTPCHRRPSLYNQSLSLQLRSRSHRPAGDDPRDRDRRAPGRAGLGGGGGCIIVHAVNMDCPPT